MTRTRDALIELNPWWKGEFEVDYKGRSVYAEIQKFLSQPQILALTGLRRVGKTTLMQKVVADRLGEGFDPKRILYFSFDEFRETPLREILQEYSTITETNLDEGHTLILFDEIQKVDDWDAQLKALYDRYRKKVKIVISGSESLFIRRRSRETLAGRMFEFKIEPLSFREHLSFRGIRFQPIGLYERELERALREFVLTQGFPELVGIADKAVLRKYINESILDKVVFRDLPTLVRIRDVGLLRSLLSILTEEPGQLLQLPDLAGQLGISRQTLSSYLSYLEDSFLIRKLYNYSASRRKAERKLKKYYPTVVSVDLLFRDDDLHRSRVFEWMVVNQLKADFFWRDPYKNEVDVVLVERGAVPVEIKYGKPELAGIPAFMRKFGVNKGYVVTRDTEGTRKVDGGTVVLVPAHRFLLGQHEVTRV